MCAFDTWLTHSTSTNSDFYRERTSKRLNNVCRPYDSRTRGSHQQLCRVKTTETSLLARRQWAYASQGKTWLQSESRDTMAAILQGGSLGFDLKVFLFFFFFEAKLYQQDRSHVGRRWGCTGACRLTRVKRLVSGFKLHSGCLLTRWTLCLRGPASCWAKVNTPKLLSKHFKGSPKLQNEKAPFSTCCSRCLLSGDEML